MPVEVIMPKVDMDMAAGTLATWHAAEGDLVAKGAALFDIETDKAAMEVEAPASGRLMRISAVPGQVVPVGTPVAWIYAEDEAQPPDEAPGAGAADPGPDPGPDPAPARQNPATTAKAASHPTSAPVTGAGTLPATPSGSQEAAAPAGGPRDTAGDIRATPAARHLARVRGITLPGIHGSGPRGRIQRADVEARATLPHPGPAILSRQTGPLHVTRRRGDGAPLVLLHGFAADSTGWAALERHLPRSLPLIRIDLPGHGRSPRPAVTCFADLARRIVDAFDDATLADGDVHVLGHSLGGALALALADIRGPRIASLTLLAPAGLGPAIDGATVAGIARASRAESLGPWLRHMAGPDVITDDFIRAAMAARNDPALRAWQSDLAETLFPDGTQSFDLSAALGRIRMPVQVIWGRQDRILPWRHALAAGGEIAIHLLPDTGHVPHVGNPGLVARLLARLVPAAAAAGPGVPAGAAAPRNKGRDDGWRPG
jgi:pyruvate dehydrogenase E2 component (dihydrolipoamide acetyltransferase)